MAERILYSLDGKPRTFVSGLHGVPDFWKPGNPDDWFWEEWKPKSAHQFIRRSHVDGANVLSRENV